MGFNSAGKFQPWGIELFDRSCFGLPKQTFNLLRACNREAAVSATGHFIKTGIDLEQRVALVCFENPSFLLEKYREYGFSFDDELISEQLVYLYYKPIFSYSVSFGTDYFKLLDEAKRLSNGGVERIVFLNAEVLFNLETTLLAELSVDKVKASFNGDDCVVLGCYQAANIDAHKNLDDVCEGALGSYLEIKRQNHLKDRRYELIVHKSPVFDEKVALELCFTPGAGFNSQNIQNIQLIKHG
jgi:hypothetical protein